MNPQINSSKVVAKRLFQLALFCLAFIFLLTPVLVQSIAQSTEERELEDKIPKHLPIRVKLKREKEKAFKDLKNEKWVRDFELEVTNIGDKPIYFLSLLLVLPEIKDSTGYNVGFTLHYGRSRLGDIKTKAESADIPIKPGETYVFKIITNQALGWESLRQKENKPQPKKISLRFQTLSFGNGTGFMGSSGLSLPQASDKKSGTGGCEQEPSRNEARVLEKQHEASN
jgi:hypothetical protein